MRCTPKSHHVNLHAKIQDFVNGGDVKWLFSKRCDCKENELAIPEQETDQPAETLIPQPIQAAAIGNILDFNHGTDPCNYFICFSIADKFTSF